MVCGGAIVLFQQMDCGARGQKGRILIDYRVDARPQLSYRRLELYEFRRIEVEGMERDTLQQN